MMPQGTSLASPFTLIRIDALALKSETHQVVGSAMEVLNIPGYGLLEKPYENALVVEFGLQEPLSYSSSATILHFG